VWIVVVCLRFSSVQPVLPELLADLEESVFEVSELLRSGVFFTQKK
jgi:hypothetical protein